MNLVVDGDTSTIVDVFAATLVVAQGGTTILELGTIVGGTISTSDTLGETSTVVPGGTIVLGLGTIGGGPTSSLSSIRANL